MLLPWRRDPCLPAPPAGCPGSEPTGQGHVTAAGAGTTLPSGAPTPYTHDNKYYSRIFTSAYKIYGKHCNYNPFLLTQISSIVNWLNIIITYISLDKAHKRVIYGQKTGIYALVVIYERTFTRYFFLRGDIHPHQNSQVYVRWPHFSTPKRLFKL